VISQERHSIAHTNFEMQLMLNANKHFVKITNKQHENIKKVTFLPVSKLKMSKVIFLK
jgi:hypothetical protein